MTIIDGIEVQIIETSSGRVLDEYDDPNTPSTISSAHAASITKFVEAKDDQPFAIQITLQKAFKWRGANSLSIHLMIDNGAVVDVSLVPSKRHFLRRPDGSLSFSIIDNQVSVDGVWKRVNFAFGAISLSMRLSAPDIFLLT